MRGHHDFFKNFSIHQGVVMIRFKFFRKNENKQSINIKEKENQENIITYYVIQYEKKIKNSEDIKKYVNYIDNSKIEESMRKAFKKAKESAKNEIII